MLQASHSTSFPKQLVDFLFLKNSHTSDSPLFNNAVIGAATCNVFWLYLYWVNIALSACTGVLGLLIGLYTNIYGQGLALRGPLGSMVSVILSEGAFFVFLFFAIFNDVSTMFFLQVRALDGMVNEQERFLFYFTLTVFFFTLCMIGDYFIMMDLRAAQACGVITIIGMVIWYRSLVRIYNRFHFKSEVNYRESTDADDWNEQFRESMDDEPGKDVTSSSSSAGAIGVPSMSAGSTPVISSKASSISAAPFQAAATPVHVPAPSAAVPSSSDSTQPTASSSAAPKKVLTFASYVAMPSGRKVFGRKWTRYYLVLRQSYLFYYKSLEDYNLNPTSPINNRPITLDGYVVDVRVTEKHFELILAPSDPEDERKSWEFRLDTETELNEWKVNLTAALARFKS